MKCFLIATVAILLATASFAQQYRSSGGAISIPDNADGIRSDIVVSGGPTNIQSMRIRFTIRHPRTNDIGVFLIRPGTSVNPPYNATTLFASSADALAYSASGASGDFQDTSITGNSDPAFTPTQHMSSATTPYSGLYRVPLSTYGTDANGTWGLAVYDRTNGQVGELVSWTLEFAVPGLNVFPRQSPQGLWPHEFNGESTMVRLDVAVISGTETLQSVGVDKLGNINDSDVASVGLYQDSNMDGYFHNSEPIIGSLQQFSGGSLTLTGLSHNFSTGLHGLFLVAVANGNASGSSFGVSIPSSGISVSSSNVNAGLPISGETRRVQGAISTLPWFENFDSMLRRNSFGTGVATGTMVPEASSINDPITMSNSGIYQGRIQNTNGSAWGVSPASGSKHILMDRAALSYLEFAFDLSAYSPQTQTLVFAFQWAYFREQPNNRSGVFLSDDDGQTWFACADRLPFVPNSPQPYSQRTVDISAACLAAGKTSFGSQFRIRIQHQSLGFRPTNGLMIDSVSLSIPTSSVRVSVGSTVVQNGSGATGPLDFGQVSIAGGPTAPVVFTVTNIGSTPLALGTPSRSGSNMYSIDTSGYLGTLTAGSSTSFSVEFDPSSSGQKDAAISFSHSGTSATTNPFSFEITGEGVVLPLITVRKGSTNGTIVGYSWVHDSGHHHIGSATPTTFYIMNTSATQLTIGTPTITGPAAGDYSLNLTGFQTVLAAQTHTSFILTFTPSMLHSRNAEVSFSHTATGTGAPPNPWYCQLTGYGTLPPQISVFDSAGQVFNGDMASGPRDFGNQELHVGPKGTIVIRVKNEGTQALAVWLPQLGGPDAGEFILNTTNFSSPLNHLHETTFTLDYDPSTLGAHSATVSFAHTGTNTTSPFTFEIYGFGLASPNIEVRETNASGAVMQPNSIATGIRDFGDWDTSVGPSDPVTFWITNTGGTDLILGLPTKAGSDPSYFVLDTTGYNTTVAPGLSTSFTVAFDPVSPRSSGASIRLTHNVPGLSSPVGFSVKGEGVSGPLLQLRANNATGEILKGNSSPAITQFGQHDVSAGPTAAKTLWIENVGSQDLTLSTPYLSGSYAGQFILDTSSFQTVLPSGSGTTVSVQFDPNVVRVCQIGIRIPHNSVGQQQNPRRFVFEGEGTSSAPLPDIRLTRVSATGAGISYYVGTSPGVGLGVTDLSVPTTPLDVYVHNAGSVSMSVGVPSMTGTDAGDFTISTSSFSQTIAPGAFTFFQIQFAPQSTGLKLATVSIIHDAGNEPSPFLFNVNGEAYSIPIIEVREDSTTGTVISNGANPAVHGRDFGSRVVGGGPSTPLTVVVRNIGSQDMIVNSVPHVLPLTGDFTVDATGFPNLIPPGGDASFTVTFEPVSTGIKNATINFAHNATPVGTSGMTNFGFAITGNGIDGPLIQVREDSASGMPIGNGSGPAGQRVFGKDAGSSSPLVVYVQNFGSSQLVLGTPTITGPDAGDFALDTTSFSNVVSAGSSTTFVVTYTSTSKGIKTATVGFTHDDVTTTTSPFVFDIQGGQANGSSKSDGGDDDDESSCTSNRSTHTLPLSIALLVLALLFASRARRKAS